MTELRRRMDEDMVGGDGGSDPRNVPVGGEGLARFYHRSPDQISDEEVQAYLRASDPGSAAVVEHVHIVVHGLRFFYHTTLKRDRTTFAIPGPRQPGTAAGDLESRGDRAGDRARRRI